SDLGRPFFDDDSLVASAMELCAKRSVLLYPPCPAGRFQCRLASERNHGMRRRTAVQCLETSFRSKIAGCVSIAPGIEFECLRDVPQAVLCTDRRTSDEPRTVAFDVSDDGVTLRGEPESKSGIQDLIARRVPAPLEDQLARSLPVGRFLRNAHSVAR